MDHTRMLREWQEQQEKADREFREEQRRNDRIVQIICILLAAGTWPCAGVAAALLNWLLQTKP